MGVGALILVPDFEGFNRAASLYGHNVRLGLDVVLTDLIHQERHFLESRIS